jgi:transposase-like protein
MRSLRRKPGTRRRYTAEQKRMILEEAHRPGQSISVVARRFGISPSLVFNWQRQGRRKKKRNRLAGEAGRERSVC